LRTIEPEAPSAPDDVEVVESPRRSRMERLGFPAGVRPFREGGIVLLLVAPIVTIAYRLWDAHWKVPFNYNGDGKGTAAYTKAIQENGWYLFNPRLAAPFGSDWRDFPFGGENIHWFTTKILGYFTDSFGVVVNVYFVGSFFLIALTSFFVARYLRFSIPTGLVIAIAYAFLPYHAYRNTAHLNRSVYYAVPLAVLVLLWMGNYKKDFLQGEENALRFRRGRVLTALLVGVLVGCSDTQNAAFLVSIFGVFALVSAARDRTWRPLALLALVGAATFGTLILNNSPFIYARLDRGANHEVANRPLNDQDRYGLRPVALVLPAPGHRIGPLRDLTDRAERGRVGNSESPGTPLGTLGTIGFVWSIGVVLAVGLGWRKRTENSSFVAELGTLNIVALLAGAIGGYAFLLALAGFGMYRTWNRISLFIAFSSLLATAVLLDKLFAFVRRKLAPRRALTIAVLVAIVGVLSLGAALDQITPRYIPNYQNTATRFDTDATFYHELEDMLPKAAMVFQLPVQPYPEAGAIEQMTDYEHFAGFLHTDHLRWSYGGMRGRPEGEWQQNLSIFDPLATLSAVASAGFEGVVINKTGFADGAEEFLTAVEPYVGAPKLVSTDDRLLYLDLTGLRAHLEQEIGDDGVERSKRAALGDDMAWTGFSFPEPVCGGTRRWATSPTPSITVTNDTDAAKTFEFSTKFEANPGATSIDIVGPGVDESVPLANGTGSFQRNIVVPPGESTIQFTLVGPKFEAPQDARPLQFAFLHYTVGGEYGSPAIDWAHQVGPACNSEDPSSGR
jgi:phosphoglycerol transferase